MLRLDLRRADFGIEHRSHRAKYACRVDADRIDTKLSQITRNLRIIRGSFSADANVTAIAFGTYDSLPEHLQHSRIAFVKIERDNIGIPVYPQCKLGEVVRANRKTVEQLRKRVNLNDVVRNLAHHVNLKTAFATLEPIGGQRRDHASAFLDGSAKGHHDAQIG